VDIFASQGVNNTVGKFATGINDTNGKFATGINGVVNTSGKATSNNVTGSKFCC
jgi:hypothetical protein